jgi:hypothetical protein
MRQEPFRTAVENKQIGRSTIDEISFAVAVEQHKHHLALVRAIMYGHPRPRMGWLG